MIGKNNGNVVWHNAVITRKHREKLNGHKSVVLWFTGLSSSGKSTLAHALEERLFALGCRSFVLDGDNIRHGLCADLGFSVRDRGENIRRIAEVANIFRDAGMIIMTAFISPFKKDRIRAREIIGERDYLEIYCCCSLNICESRDTKGFYKKAKAGELKEFTGISSPYENPEHPDLSINTGELSLDVSVEKVLELLKKKKIINAPVRN